MESRKKLFDLRGPQGRIGRLASFYLEGYVHMLFYRIMVPLAVVYGAFIAAYLLFPGLGAALKIFTAAVWILWTPQFIEVAKGLSLAWSRGMAYGRLNREFAALYRKRYSTRSGGYVAFPIIVTILWTVGFIVMLVRWHP
jgi:hypothetical protein